MAIITDRMYLRELEVKDFEQIWNLVETNTDSLPVNWPIRQSKFYDWLYLGLLDDFSTKYIVDYINEDNENIVVGLVSIDIITNQNQMYYRDTNVNDVDITYLTSTEFSGMGVATFAVNEISKKLIENNYKPIMRIPSSQKASSRIAIKCGFIKIDDESIDMGYDYDRVNLEIFRKIIA